VTPACVTVYRATNEQVQAFWGSKSDPAQVENARTELSRFLPVLEAALQGRDWLERDFSLADVAFAPHLSMLRDGGYDFAPAVERWLERLFARPAWTKTRAIVFG
jgi:glutathione S-transferase